MVFIKNLKRILFPKKKTKSNKIIRKNAQKISIQDRVYLNVYWKVLKIGKGPAVTFNIDDQEILKFDCFGKDDGHYHIFPNYKKRIFFSEQTAREQIKRTAIELKTNLNSYLLMHDSKDVRNVSINQEKLEKAVEVMKEKMIFFLENVPEIKGI